ncbi:MAG: hypothetical protein ACO1RT_08075 [Planctomycetaceae bacterium]
MTEAVKPRSIFATPAMSAEGEPAVELEVAPVRLSGLIALGLGLLSFVAVLGAPLIIVPIVAAAFALFALRPYPGERPVGIVAAWIGLFCAVMFGVWGISERHFKDKAMGAQATRFAGEWLRLVGQGDLELALELQVHPSRRQPESMPLADYYQRSTAGIDLLKQFKEQEVMPRLIELGTRPQWQPARAPKVYTLYGRELTQTVWRDTTGSYPQLIKIVLEYLPQQSSTTAQWKIELVSDFLDDSDRL